MASRRKGKTKQRKTGGARKGGWRALVASRSFAPVMGLWGAALGGLGVMVLPESLVRSLTQGTLIGTFAVPAQPLVAGALALVLGAALFAIAAVRSAELRRRLYPSAISDVVARKVRPIDPVRDLGSESIDDPVETMPFASPAWRDPDAGPEEEADEDEGDVPLVPGFMRRPAPEAEVAEDEVQPLPRFMTHPVPEPEPESEPESAPSPALPAQSVPIELDLAQFAELPGRNAVWVEVPPAVVPAPEAAPEAEAAPEPVAAPAVLAMPDGNAAPATRRRAAPPPPLPGTAALARLRAVPASELSMVEMVERFAGALHEHRASSPVRSLSAAELAAREAALVEALKALAALSGIGAADAAVDAEEPLRAALRQFQPRRGAA